MTANMDPLQPAANGPTGSAPSSPSSSRKDAGKFGAGLGAAQRNDPAAEPLTPTFPLELSANIAAAARAWDTLAAAGQSVSFDDSGERLRIVLAGEHGSEAMTLSGSELFALIDRDWGQ